VVSPKRPLASIVISNFNGKDMLRECLNSLMNLNYPRFEVVVVDAGSTDGAPEMVQADFPSVRLVRREKIGIGEALNVGLSQSRGEVIVFDLNNDDAVSPDWLDHLVDALISSPDIGVVCGKRYLADTDKLDSAGSKIVLGVTLGRGHGKPDSGRYDSSVEVDYAPVLATRRDVLERVGPLDESYYIYGEDVDFSLRARKAGYKVVYVPEAIFRHMHSATIGEWTPARLRYLTRSRIRLIVKHYPLYQKLPLLLLHLSVIPVFYVFFYTYLARGRFIEFVKAQLGAFKWNWGLLRKR
jgi:hypothetical protein